MNIAKWDVDPVPNARAESISEARIESDFSSEDGADYSKTPQSNEGSVISRAKARSSE